MLLRNVILRSLKTANIHFFCKRQATFGESFNYDHYFRCMQKTSRPNDAIQLHEKFEKEVQNSIKYMGITLRNMTRLLNKHDNQDVMLINNFIAKRQHQLQLLDLSQFNSKECSDFVLFFVGLTEVNAGKIQEELKTWVKMLLKYYIQKHFDAKEDRMSNIQILMSVITSMHNYYPKLQQEYMDVVIAIFGQYQQQLITENLTFFTFAEMLNKLSSNSNNKLIGLTDSISDYIIKHNLIVTFQYNTLANLLSALFKIKLNATNHDISNVQALIGSIEEYMCSSMSKMSAKDMEDSVPILIQVAPESQFIKHFINVIAFSINKAGRTCVEPLFIVQSLSWMKQQQINTIKELIPQWEQYLHSFLRIYFNQRYNYKRNTWSYFEKILENRALTKPVEREMKEKIRIKQKATRPIQIQ